jgi:hypothetical protein
MPMSVKSSVQLEQEAAEVMSMGGGVQFYFQQNRDLSLKPWLATPLSEVGAFCREREKYCHKAKAIPQIALLYPTDSYLKNGLKPYANPTGMLEGALNLVLDGQHSVEILMEHHLRGKMEQYPLIIIPECDYLEASFLEELRGYLRGGGKLLIIGTETSGLFKNELGIKSLVKIDEGPLFIAASDRLGAILSSSISVELLSGANEISTFYSGNDFRDKGRNISSSSNKVGKGTIEGVYFNSGSAYLEYKSPVLRNFISNRITELFPEQMVKVNGSHLVHVTVNQLNNKMYVNLVNVAGEHTNEKAIGYDEIPSIKGLIVSINTIKRPSKILLQPGGQQLDIEFQNGVSKIIVPELSIYSIIEVIL